MPLNAFCCSRLQQKSSNSHPGQAWASARKRLRREQREAADQTVAASKHISVDELRQQRLKAALPYLKWNQSKNGAASKAAALPKVTVRRRYGCGCFTCTVCHHDTFVEEDAKQVECRRCGQKHQLERE